ncbi:protein phosphatase 1 regulatory subunit 1B isoform X1 [Denticeps clupeoides]|uniref:protein phosphatase 1 regulatory subunit 1B isoform X1 n=1 Tax=Denticeps clupeoides TaxID=299321 RepID=UPI0010A417E9|nr:protein phosphatase 1 regulatory subunit 1B isoform X1 [Denticeps clupeoides]
MDPAAAASEVVEEPKERKKIHFAVPATAPTQLDPRQVEMIRRRRPTPATLFRVADQSSPEEDNSTHQWVVGENGVLKPKRVNPNVYQPPSLKAVQQMAEAQMQKLGVYPHMEEEHEDCSGQGEVQERDLIQSSGPPEETSPAETESELNMAEAIPQSDEEGQAEEDEDNREEES